MAWQWAGFALHEVPPQASQPREGGRDGPPGGAGDLLERVARVAGRHDGSVAIFELGLPLAEVHGRVEEEYGIAVVVAYIPTPLVVEGLAWPICSEILG